MTTASSVGAKGDKGASMEGGIARWYAKNTAKDRRLYQQAAQVVAQRVPPGATVLELAPGPGYAALEVARQGCYRLHGLDISHTFVEIAQGVAQDEGVSIDFRQGDAAHMPYPDAMFDFIFCQSAFKNFTDPVGAMNEMHRVLRPGGVAWIQDLRKDAPPSAIRAYVEGMGLGWLSKWMTLWTFRSMLLKRAYPQGELEKMAQRSAFGACRIEQEPIVLNVWLEKSQAAP